MKEVWKDIFGYEGYYQVSNLGRVRSYIYLYKKSNGNNRSRLEVKVLKESTLPKGYKYVRLSVHGKSKSYLVHRLVAENFICNYKNKPQVNHKNFIKSDNRAENLEWCNQNENVIHFCKFGSRKKTQNFGNKNGNCKLNEKQVLEIIKLDGISNKKIGAIYGISGGHVGNIKRRQTWKFVLIN